MKRTFLFYALALPLLAACSADDADAPLQSEDGLPVTIAVGITDGAGTRAADNILSTRFEGGETFNAYLTGCTVSNTIFTMNTDQTTATPVAQPFKKKGVDGEITAYYPSSVTNSGPTTWTVEDDQTGDDAYKQSDLMYGTAAINADGKANLVFQHRMAKLLIRATCGEGVKQIRSINVIKGYRQVGIQDHAIAMPYQDGSDLDQPISATSPLKVLAGGTGQTAYCAALLPPQSIAAGTGNEDRFLEVDTNKGMCWFNLRSATGGPVTFESGKSYTLILPIDANIIGLTATIKAWETTDDQVVYNEL